MSLPPPSNQPVEDPSELRARRSRFMSRYRKKLLAERFRNFPLLRLLILKTWFRIAFLLLVGAVLTIALLLPKIWRVTPKDFLPVIRISLLDRLQSWSLQRSARRAMADNRFDDALYSWKSAVANNPADTRAISSMLRTVLQSGASPGNASLAVGQSLWLLRLTSTNLLSLDLAVGVFEQYNRADIILSVLQSVPPPLSPRLESAFLKALFNQGQMDAFAQKWSSSRISGDGEILLYGAAFQAGWKKGPESEAGWKQLESVQEDPRWRLLSNRLQLRASLQTLDFHRYEQVLNRLVELGGNKAIDHAGLWLLLKERDQLARAQQLARSYPYPPVYPADLVAIANAQAALDLRPEAKELIRRHLKQFADSEIVWYTYANLLLQDKEWEALMALALEVRQSSAVKNALEAYTFYLEGCAELGQERRAPAEQAFAKLVATASPAQSLFLSSELIRLGFPELASDLLVKVESSFQQNPNYWSLLFSSQFEARRTDRLLTAAAAFYQLRPDNLAAMNNYAAALLLMREQPEEAIKLTFQIMKRIPNEIGPHINHCLALLLNGRTAEAEKLLLKVRPENLRSVESSSYHLAWFEVCFNQQRWKEALEHAQDLPLLSLFPIQRNWLEEKQRFIQARLRGT